jgi:hypothetical protein
MTTIFHQQALQKSGGLQQPVQPDLNGLNDIMLFLPLKPMLKANVL